MSQPTRIITISMVTLLTVANVAAAQDEPGTMGAAIREGACNVDGPVVARLSSVSSEFMSDGVATAGALPVGSDSAIPVAASITTIPLDLADMVAAEHSIAVLADESAGASVVACGDIGGRTLGERELPVALVAVDGSAVAGVAVVEDIDTNAALVAVYVVGRPGTATEVAAGVTDVTLEALLHFAGLDITVEGAEWDADSGAITIDAVYDNPNTGATSTSSLQLNGQPSIVLGDDVAPLQFVDQEAIPARSAVRAQLRATGLEPETKLGDVSLVYGRPDQHQATLVLAEGESGDSQAVTDVRIPRKQRKAKLKGFANLAIKDAALVPAGCGGRLDALVLAPVSADELAMIVTVTATGRAPLGGILQAFLLSPDGTSSVGGNGVTTVRRGETLRDLTYCFAVPAPGPGDYVLRFEGGDRKANVRLVAPSLADGG